MPNYNQYTANEFIQDALFLEWIYENTPSSAAFWDNWISRRPSNLEEFLEAEQAIRMLAAIFGQAGLFNETTPRSCISSAF